MKKVLFFLCLLLAANCFSQFSKTHYIPPLSNSDAQEPQGQFMYISCPSLTPVNFRIIALGGEVVNGTVTRDNPYVFNIGAGFDTQLLVSSFSVNSVMQNKGYIVEAEDQVYVTVRMTTTPMNFQGGGLVSKGLAALGTQFRVGAFINTLIPSTNENHYTFASVLATDNNTEVTFTPPPANTGITLINHETFNNTPQTVTLNRGESFTIAVQGPNNANDDGLIGTLISSNKPIAVNCGSIAGTDGDASNLDLGFDQIVSAERTGSEYIFIKGNGLDVVERPLVVANEPNTEVFLNGDPTPTATLDAGQYLSLNGANYGPNGNLYIRTSHNVFAYQGMGGQISQANQNMCFLPPLSCETPRVIDNIPLINQIGSLNDFIGTVNIVTEIGATLSFIINGETYSFADLPPGITANGPFSVPGNTAYETYTFQGLQGNISVYSTKQVYLSYFGSSGAATYGGFYSGFTFKPEVAFKNLDTSMASNCIPNIELSVNVLTAFDEFQWYFNDVAINGATGRTYIPDAPGFYYVKAGISACNTELISDKIPVSSCAPDSDNDGINDNADVDLDNDGISNCVESDGNASLDLSPASTGQIQVGTYMNQYSFSAGPATGPQVPTPFNGSATGSFIMETVAGIGNTTSEQFNFTNPASIVLDYPATADVNDFLTPDGEYKLQVSTDKTITLLNPDDQLLVDTNYDGIFESGITQFSSFEVRFRLNGSLPLTAGSGTFSFRAKDVTSLIFTQKNLIDSGNTKATFGLSLPCLPKDTDGDGIADRSDSDSDNDGIPDSIEAVGNLTINAIITDENHNGMNDTIEPGLGQLDTDGDNVPDFYDLDSDNDGIYDVTESGSNATDANRDGVIDGNAFGINGLLDALETAPDSGILNFNIANTDSIDNIPDSLSADSDGDGCNDVIEAGLNDGDGDGRLGVAPVTVNPANGKVTSATGYSALPNNNYIIAAPIIINTQPINQTGCEAQQVTFTIDTNTVNGYKWQVGSNEAGFTDLVNNTQYSGVDTASLTVSMLTPSMSGNHYRVLLQKDGNSCGLVSALATLTVLARPVVAASITLVQCDDDLDNLSDFNLRQKESQISANAANETFAYFTTQNGAETNDVSEQITNETVYNNSNGNTVWVRITNNDGCYNVTRIDLIVSATQIPAGFSRSFSECDDFLDVLNDDHDGITGFNFSSVTADINAILGNGSNYTIKYYKNEADALQENDAAGNALAINDVSNYRNTGYPNQQFIWVRIDSNADNACFGLGPYITLTVEALPLFHAVPLQKECDRDVSDAIIDHDFQTAGLQDAILNGQADVSVAYFDQDNNPLPSPLPNPFRTATQNIRVVLTNDNGRHCTEEGTISFIVYARPVAHAVTVPAQCDDLPDDSDGIVAFDTTTIESDLLQGQTGFIIKYFDEDGTPLSSPLPPTFQSRTQNVRAVVENPLNPDCADATMIAFTVNPLPEILDDNEEIICSGIVNESVTLYAGLANGNPGSYAYEWARNGILIPNAIIDFLTVDEDGVYTTKIINKITGCSRTRTNTVEYSQTATITTVDIDDLSDVNSISINVTGVGNYQYSLDNPVGPFQDSAYFDNVTPGLHEVFVNDKNGCGMATKTVAVVGAPAFFTPNGDGYNDYWKIKGMNALYHKNSIVYIFDRYGKLLTEIPSGADMGWDGIYNGNPLPADDYWFLLKLDDGRTARGHFALKR
ncbi:T9SS type B sorting domain-containing protein [Flavobacterium pallidum]|uniref:Gliding motility protein n=1 Tax=Flavobacterium pallidum TaxID=2172098 RepID=A0A2S1SI50_9FLAO|nr:T9SS type B sorting domain-containing protein [Flavobacterium pallidum]AWI26065.1 gliding motility protein [Flavobacterium pallidum]